MAVPPNPNAFRPTPTQQMLDELETAVSAAGGQALTRHCTPQDLDYRARPRGLPAASRWVPQPLQQSCTCHNETLLSIPPEGRPDDAPAIICAICDAGILFPRFRDTGTGVPA